MPAFASTSVCAACCAAIGGASFALLNLCSFFKGVDDSVLPAVFLEVGSTLGVVGPSAWQHVDALLEAASEAQRGQFRCRAEDGADRATYWRRRLSVGLSLYV